VVGDLAKKLGLKPGQTVCLIAAPAASARLVRREAPPGIRFVRSAAGRKLDHVFLWPSEVRGLGLKLSRIQRDLAPDGSVWVVMPKKAFAPARGVRFTWEEMQAEALKSDFVDNKIATIDQRNYGTRFVIRKERRPKAD
jgi:hypothetical protein